MNVVHLGYKLLWFTWAVNYCGSIGLQIVVVLLGCNVVVRLLGYNNAVVAWSTML